MATGRRLNRSDISEVERALKQTGGNKKQAAALLGIQRSTFYKRLENAGKVKPDEREKFTIRDAGIPGEQTAEAIAEEEARAEFATEHTPEVGKHSWEIRSDKANKYRFLACGDLHAASKYCRWDVRAGLMKHAEEWGAQAVLDCGNWIDGEASFNRYDLECVGMDAQIQNLASNYLKSKVPTYAVTGADHEGWYIRREGVDIGRYAEAIMRDAGHPWTNLGYIEADILLRNANSGKAATLRVMHAGGGSAYAISYRPQKILESYEGGEKPDVTLIGHYHKLDAGLIRNVWYGQVGCQQDQTPFMRQRSLEAHVGGILLEIEQDPGDGSISGFRPDMRRYFTRSYYFKSGQANQRWSGHGPIKQIPRAPNVKE
jgi:hypothetical protein